MLNLLENLSTNDLIKSLKSYQKHGAITEADFMNLQIDNIEFDINDINDYQDYLLECDQIQFINLDNEYYLYNEFGTLEKIDDNQIENNMNNDIDFKKWYIENNLNIDTDLLKDIINKCNEPKNNELKITWNHNGKMQGIASLSTSPLLNNMCQKRCKMQGSICGHCYSVAMNKRYTNLQKSLTNNTKLLNSLIDKAKLPTINNKVFRFEAFGDLNSYNQCINYFNICNKNKGTTFSIWCKNIHIMSHVINDMGYRKPKNLIVIYSVSLLNHQININKITSNPRLQFIDKVFTVYTLEYLQENNINIDKFINCGARKCTDCMKCYNKRNKTVFINEMLKSDMKRYSNVKKGGKQ